MAPRQSSTFLRSLAALTASVPFLRAGMQVPGQSPPLCGTPTSGEDHADSASRLRRSLRFSTAEGMIAEVFTACAGTTVLTAWAMHLGVEPVVVGLLTALPFLSQAIQLPSAHLCARIGARPVALVAVAASRFVWLPLGLVPLLEVGPAASGALLLGVAAVSAVASVAGNNGWTVWMGDLVPRRVRGRYFGARSALATTGGIAATFAAGAVLDVARHHGAVAEALALLALAAVLAGLVTTLLMSRQHAPPHPKGPRLQGGLREALRDDRLRRYLGYHVAWQAAVGLATSYFALYMLRDLKMSFLLVALHAVGTALVRVAIGPLWGRAIDRVGARPVLVVCSFGVALIPAYWILARPDSLWPVALDVVVSGALWSGHALASFALPLSIAPRQNRALHLAVLSTGGGLAFATATLLAGGLATALPDRVEWAGHQWLNLHVLFAIAALFRLAAALLGLRVTEPGARSVDALLGLIRGGVVARVTRIAR